MKDWFHLSFCTGANVRLHSYIWWRPHQQQGRPRLLTCVMPSYQSMSSEVVLIIGTGHRAMLARMALLLSRRTDLRPSNDALACVLLVEGSWISI